MYIKHTIQNCRYK